VTRFITELTLIAFPLKVLFLLPFTLLGLQARSTTAMADTGSALRLLWLGGLAVPMVETFVGQWLPLRVLARRTRDKCLLLIGSALWFAALHLAAGWSGFVYIFPMAVLLSWSFMLYSQRSLWRAYWVTTAIHVLHNCLAISLYLLLKTAAQPV
jgi:hypothetical protein